MQRLVVTSMAALVLAYSAATVEAAPRQRRAPRAKPAAAPLANFGFAGNGLGMGGLGLGGGMGFGFGNGLGMGFAPFGNFNAFGYAPYGFGSGLTGYGYPGYAYGYPRPVYTFGATQGGGLPAYNYAADPFGGSPNGPNYDYWLTQQAAHGNISWAEANKRIYGN